MKRIIVLVLACMILLSLCACSNGGITAEDMAGEWESNQVDWSVFIMEGFKNSDDESIAEILPYMEYGPLNVIFRITLSSPNSFSVTLDEETLRASDEAYMEQTKIGVGKYLDDVVIDAIAEAGYTVEEYRELLGISAEDDLLAALGVDEAAMYEHIDTYMSTNLAAINSEANVNGMFEIKGNVLTLISEDGKDVFTIAEGANSFTASEENIGNSLMAGLGSITFTRVEG